MILKFEDSLEEIELGKEREGALRKIYILCFKFPRKETDNLHTFSSRGNRDNPYANISFLRPHTLSISQRNILPHT